MKNVTVDIVLASYNGEKYIAEQIESILQQTHSNIQLYISDDGSQDKTVHIIQDFMKRDARVHLVNSERVGGVIKNFEKGLSFVNSDYIMLSDQDDYWLKDKVEKSLECIISHEEKLGASVPVLVFSDLALVDQELAPISDSFYQSAGLNPERNLHYDNLSWMGSVMGCTIIMNKVACNQALPFHDPVIMHDHWLAMKTLETGSIFYLNDSLIKYRQHSSNVSGGLGFKRQIWKKIFNFKTYKTIVKRARIIRSIHGTDTLHKRLLFSKKIIKGFRNCETIKYPIMFLVIFLFCR